MQFSKTGVVCYGEIHWDILPTVALPGGASMNVTYHLEELGENSIFITKIESDSDGKELFHLIEQNEINTDFFQMDFDHPTGLVYAHSNEYQEMSYDIVYPSAWGFIRWEDRFIALLQRAEYFVYSSLTSRSVESRNTLYQLLELAKTKVLDINLHPPFFNRPHIEYLLGEANILKMNIHELELITGWFSNILVQEDRIRLLQDEFNIDTIIVTMDKKGAMVNHQGSNYYHPEFAVRVADMIGSGNAFLARLLHQMIIGKSIQDAPTFVSGFGALIATYCGACPQYNHSNIAFLINYQTKKIVNQV